MQPQPKQIAKIIVLLIIFATIWQIYKLIFGSVYGNFLEQTHIAEVPHSIKCFFNEQRCDEGDIDGWSVCYGLCYFIIGLIVPDQYFAIIVISILVEIVQPYF